MGQMDVEKTIEFVLQQQAQFSVDLNDLGRTVAGLANKCREPDTDCDHGCDGAGADVEKPACPRGEDGSARPVSDGH
jgi:hypothetical protein